MAILVEDGSVVSGANSYATEAELTAYAADRAVTLTADTDVLLIKAMDFIEAQDYKGDKSTKGQPLQWPRDFVYIDGYAVDSDEIPELLKQAQMQTALSIDEGNDPLATIGRATKREKADVLEVEYMDNAASAPIIVSISRLLRKLLKSGSGSSFTVIRA